MKKLIQYYKELGYSHEEAVQLAKDEMFAVSDLIESFN